MSSYLQHRMSVNKQKYLYYLQQQRNIIENSNKKNYNSVDTRKVNKIEKNIPKDPEDVEIIQKKFIDEISLHSPIERLKILQKQKIIRVFKVEHNYSDQVELLENYIVRKKIARSRLGYHLFSNEVKSLLQLSGNKHFPQILGYNPQSFEIYMTYCGQPLTWRNLPDDWKDQVKEISTTLINRRVNSNDMIVRNTTILNGVIYIIDFGLNNQFNEDITVVLRNFYYKINELSFQKFKNLENLRLT